MKIKLEIELEEEAMEELKENDELNIEDITDILSQKLVDFAIIKEVRRSVI
jgi:DNA-dependent RNA polymerase auxiliary subunit epsilon